MDNSSAVLLYLNQKNICSAVYENNKLSQYQLWTVEEGVVNKEFFVQCLNQQKLNHPYIQQYYIGVDDKKIMLSPFYWTEHEIKAAFDELHFIDAGEELLLQHINWQNYKGVYSIKSTSRQLFNSASPQVQLFNNHLALINLYQSLVLKHYTPKLYKICVQRSDEHFIASVFKNEKLLLHNVYPFVSVDDVHYFIQQFLNFEGKNLTDAALYVSNLKGKAMPLETFELEHLIPFERLQQDELRHKEYISNLLAIVS